MKKCKSCGDGIADDESRYCIFSHLGIELQPGEMAYCLECADDLYRGKISVRRARLFSSSRSRHWHWRPGEESGNSGENAIRVMEDRNDD
jgi:hypothetical protein